jgi:hypothetical protein
MPHEIELMVSIRRQGENGIKRRGDVITCRLAGGSWGSSELKVHQVVLWPGSSASELELQSSALIQAILNKKKEWGQPNPTVDFPFCEVVTEPVENDNGEQLSDFNGNPIFQTAMTNRSVLRFDIDSIPEQQINDVLNSQVQAEFLSADDLSIYIEERGVDKRKPEQRGKKEHRDLLDEDPVLHSGSALRRDETTDIVEFLSQTNEPIKSWSI